MGIDKGQLLLHFTRNGAYAGPDAAELLVLDREGGDPAVGQLGDEAALFGRGLADPHPGRQQQLLALQQGGDVGHLAGVHPADLAPQQVLAGDHFRQAPLHRRQSEDPA